MYNIVWAGKEWNMTLWDKDIKMTEIVKIVIPPPLPFHSCSKNETIMRVVQNGPSYFIYKL